MNYGLIYTIPFSSSRGERYLISIEKKGYTGKTTELIANEHPFVTHIIGNTDDNVYSSVRTSRANIRLFGGDYLQNLFSTDYQDFRVCLKKDGRPVWWGFIVPELYTQDYSSSSFTYELECISGMQVLENIEFEGTEARGLKSFESILRDAIFRSNCKYESIYIPHVFASSKEAYLAGEEILKELMISEQNFFDEDDIPMSYLEVLTEICKFLGWQLVDESKELILFDADANQYDKYSIGYTGKGVNFTKSARVESGIIKVQDIGYDGNNHFLNLQKGYNKVKIVTNNYKVKDALPEIDFSEFEEIGVKKTEIPDFSKCITYQPLEGSDVEMAAYSPSIVDTKVVMKRLSITEEKNLYANESPIVGAIPQHYDVVKKNADGEPERVDWNFQERIQIPIKYNSHPLYKDNKVEIIRLKGVPSVYQGGAFAINFSTKVTLLSETQHDKGFFQSLDFEFIFRIGENYYHGKSSGEEIWNNSQNRLSDYPNNLDINFKGEAKEPGPAGSLTDFKGDYELFSSRTLDDGYNGLKGFIIKLPQRIISGDLELIIYGPDLRIPHGAYNYPKSITISDFAIDYKMQESTESMPKEKEDRVYENIINEDYINEFEEIETKISSYNNDGACFSKVTMKGQYVTDNLYCSIVGENIRPEEFLIRRYVNQFSGTRFKLSQELCKSDLITAYNKIIDDSLPGKEFAYLGGDIDYQSDTQNCIMVEKA